MCDAGEGGAATAKECHRCVTDDTLSSQEGCPPPGWIVILAFEPSASRPNHLPTTPGRPTFGSPPAAKSPRLSSLLRLLTATTNTHKIAEIRAILNPPAVKDRKAGGSRAIHLVTLD